MIKKIVFVLVGIVVLIYAYSYIFNYIDNKNEWKKTINRMDLSDHCINNTYISNYIGVSIVCPNGLMAVETFNGYERNPKEGVIFINLNNKMEKQADLIEAQRMPSFFVRLRYEKFSPSDYYDTTNYESNTLNQVDPLNFVNKAEAMIGPKLIKVENIKKVNVGDNNYYTYSRGVGTRTDYFFYEKGNNYIEFTFNNQSEYFIKSVLGSVKMNTADNFY